MTIRQFQELYFIAQSDDIDIDKSIKMVGAITGITPDRVDKMSMRRFNRICESIQNQFNIINKKLDSGRPQKYAIIGWRVYRISYDISKPPMNSARYVEALTFGTEIIPNLHKILASMVQPLRWSWRRFKFVGYDKPHTDIALDMERMNFQAAYQAAVFFYILYSESMKIIQPYLIQELKAKGVDQSKAQEILTSSINILDGFLTPKWSLNMRQYLLNRFGT